MVVGGVREKDEQGLGIGDSYKSFIHFLLNFMRKFMYFLLKIFGNFNLFISVHRNMVSDRLENVTQTISKLLEGYDIRLRPNFGGN